MRIDCINEGTISSNYFKKTVQALNMVNTEILTIRHKLSNHYNDIISPTFFGGEGFTSGNYP